MGRRSTCSNCHKLDRARNGIMQILLASIVRYKIEYGSKLLFL